MASFPDVSSKTLTLYLPSDLAVLVEYVADYYEWSEVQTIRKILSLSLSGLEIGDDPKLLKRDLKRLQK